MTVVLKVGGASAGGAAAAVAELREQGNGVCVVHGAGPQISDEMARRGLKVRFVGGRRVTTPEALAVGLGAARIVFLTDVPGVFFEGRLLHSIPAADAVEMVGAGSFDGGIVPKLLAAAGAARNGLQADIGLTAVIA